MLSTFRTIEDADYLANEPIEDQKAKIKRKMQIETSALAQLEANKEAMEEEWDKEAYA